jgi:hypothetical protein
MVMDIDSERTGGEGGGGDEGGERGSSSCPLSFNWDIEGPLSGNEPDALCRLASSCVRSVLLPVS